jgi:hypothetical protein
MCISDGISLSDYAEKQKKFDSSKLPESDPRENEIGRILEEVASECYRVSEIHLIEK